MNKLSIISQRFSRKFGMIQNSHKLASQAIYSSSFAQNTVMGGMPMRNFASGGKIVYTLTDEAPALATRALLPIYEKFARVGGVEMERSDISLAARVLAHFPDCLSADQKVPDALADLGVLAKKPEAVMVKTPNISASIPQLKLCIAELQAKGFAIPDYPSEPKGDKEKKINQTYAKVLGSAVNPVLREGNSDRRVAAPVKSWAAKNPHKMMPWSRACRTHVGHMTANDFYSNEQSVIMSQATEVTIEHKDKAGVRTVLKISTPLEQGEVIDSTFMSAKALAAFYDEEIKDAKDTDMLLSLHLKATMMKKSDPIMFGHAVKAYFKAAFTKHEQVLRRINANPNNGLAAVLASINEKCDAAEAAAIIADFDACYETGPSVAMVNSAKGITNLHVPSDVIIDASVPVVVRDSGKMWNADNKLQDTKVVIPDRCYAQMYNAVFSYCKVNGQFNVSTMGNVPNVGLMAKKAEEYGSHDKTFEIADHGTVSVVDKKTGQVLMSHEVEKGDIWRMCQTKDAPIVDWVRLAVSRAKATGNPAVFFLDEKRAHDVNMINLVQKNLINHDLTGLDIRIMNPVDAINYCMTRCTAGQDTIGVSGNVLRDYLTDLFPIIELGTSAKMLSIVPLLAGGGLFETGAGGSAPKHVEQFLEEGHLRWDSLGEYLATAAAFEHLGAQGHAPAELLGKTLNIAVGRHLDRNRNPSRKVKEADNRASAYYLALYWADALAAEDEAFKGIAAELNRNRAKIISELKGCQGRPVDLDGYFYPDEDTANSAMRPSATFNKIIDAASN